MDKSKQKLLLHACCAPCASGVLPQIVDDYDITILFFNPNIDTVDEYNLRLDALQKYIALFNKEYDKDIKIIAPPYNHTQFSALTKGREREREGGTRCEICFSLRLDFAAKLAYEQGFSMFATTLSVSPHKDYQVINFIGKQVADKYGTNYLTSNFKKNNGYLSSIQNSKKYALYRQTYCGCSRQTV